MVNSNCYKITDKLYECENQTKGMLYENYDCQCHMKLNSHDEHTSFNEDRNILLQLSKEHSGYQVLPKKFFKYTNVPPPLVRISWLKLASDTEGSSFNVNDEFDTSGSESDDEGSSKEDSIPLSDLKLKLSSEDMSHIRHNLCKTSMVVIQRKRGRPKKTTENQECNIDDSLNNEYDGSLEELSSKESQDSSSDWWTKNLDLIDDNELYMNDIKVNDSQENYIENCQENNVCETDVKDEKNEEDSAEVKHEEDKHLKESNKKKNKKDVKNEMGGVKMENSKVVFPCMDCGKTFSAASTLKYHLRIHNGTLIKCPECDKGFTTNYLLKCHMRLHSGDLFMCHKCGRGFTTAELLKVHSRSHTGIRPYKCNICGKCFPSASNLTQHKETHEPEKKYLCFQCGSSFSQKRCLDGHMLSHGEKNHICTVCGKLWARKSDLTEHMRVHTGYKPYACNNCDQKFTQASSLRRHQIVHMNTNPIQCIVCGKMLKCDEYYKRHMKKHLKEEAKQNSATK